ncbi:MAG: DUF1295 domain-containing protein [Pseudomonadales bacterium]
MEKAQPYLVVLVVVAIAGLVSLAANQGSVQVAGVPLFGLCVALAFIIQWVVFVPAYIKKTERFFDLCGSLTFISVALFALSMRAEIDPRSVVITVLVVTWAVRLGTFLAARVAKEGDRRFNKMKHEFGTFLQTWTLQGLWVTLSLGAGLAALTSANSTPLGWIGVLGVAIWVCGFIFQAVSDQQKKTFRAQEENSGKFINIGLWAWSRHPNYFGEICVWTGITVLALPALSGWQYVTLISPLFVYILLTRISGVPMLERRGKKEWGDDPEYQAYVQNVPVLFPKPPK